MLVRMMALLFSSCTGFLLFGYVGRIPTVCARF